MFFWFLFNFSFTLSAAENCTGANNQANKVKTFIREYSYSASDDDSKNSSRKKAIKQLKRLLSEEVGTYIQSSLDIVETSKDGVSQENVKNEISTLSSSITKINIIKENWNGTTYYVKANVKIDEDQAMQLLLEAIRDKSAKKDVVRLNKILDEQKKTIGMSFGKIGELKKKLVAQEIKNQASLRQVKEQDDLLKKLVKLKKEYDIKAEAQKTELGRIKNLVNKAKSRISKDTDKACLLTPHMTRGEVLKTLGKPSGKSDDDVYWDYGASGVEFLNGLVIKIWCFKKWEMNSVGNKMYWNNNTGGYNIYKKPN